MTTYDETIEQVAELFPYLSMAERFDWWLRLGCDLSRLTVNMTTLPYHPQPVEQPQTPATTAPGPSDQP